MSVSPQDRVTTSEQPAMCRSRTTNQPLRGRANGNTVVGRRVRDLYRAFLVRMGHPTDAISQASALNAAELAVAVELARLSAARGEAVDVDQLIRLSNLADRAAKRLVRRRASGGPPPLSALNGLVLPSRERFP
jgi:hypothetical protein